MFLCCSQDVLPNPRMPVVHHIAVNSFLSHLDCMLTCSNVISGFCCVVEEGNGLQSGFSGL